MSTADFLLLLLSFTGAAVTVIWTVALAIGRIKRTAARTETGQLSVDELEDIRARLAELEDRDARVDEIEERLDFVERVLRRPPEAKPLPNPQGQD